MGGGRQVVGGGPVAEAGAVDDAEPLQFLQVAVDRGQVHVGGVGADLGGQFLRAAVFLAAEQGLQQQPPGRGGPSAVLADERDDVVDLALAVMSGRMGVGSWGHEASIRDMRSCNVDAIANPAGDGGGQPAVSRVAAGAAMPGCGDGDRGTQAPEMLLLVSRIKL